MPTGPDTLQALFRAGWPGAAAPCLLQPGARTLTYADVWSWSGRLAVGLAGRGVVPGDRVLVQAPKSPAVLALWLACVRSGAVFLPVNPDHTAREVAIVREDAEPAVVLAEEDLRALGDGADDRFEDRPADADTPAALLYTSGTTGRPKGALLTHRNLASNADALRTAWRFGHDDVLLHALPLFHAHGLLVACDVALASGCSMIFLPRFEVPTVLDQLPRSSVFMGVPTHYTRLLADPGLEAAVPRDFRLFVSGSAPLPAPTHEEFRRRTGHVVLERYGMTETLMLTSNPYDGERRPGTVGVPLPGVEVRLDDGGNVEVRGPNVFSGYWRRPDLGEEFTPDGFFRTGDVGVWDDGYLRLVGRARDLVITGGFNVYPLEVEDVLASLPGIAEAAVVGVPDADLGEAVVAAVVPSPGTEPDPDEVRRAARALLAGYKVPKRIVPVQELPRNAMGKVDKAGVRELVTGSGSEGETP